MKRLPEYKELKGTSITKGELAKTLYPDATYDTTLPQMVVDDIRSRFNVDITSIAVMGYGEGSSTFGVMLPLTQEAAGMLLRYSNGCQDILLEQWAAFGLKFYIEDNPDTVRKGE